MFTSFVLFFYNGDISSEVSHVNTHYFVIWVSLKELVYFLFKSFKGFFEIPFILGISGVKVPLSEKDLTTRPFKGPSFRS